MHPFSHHQNPHFIPQTITIFDIASNITQCVEQAENTYFHKDSTSPSKFSQIGGLLPRSQGVWELPIEPRNGVFVNPVKFLKILKDVLKTEREKVFEGYDNYQVIVSSIEMEKINMKILKHENHTYSLTIESKRYGIIQVVLKQIHTSSLEKRIQMRLKALEEKK